MAIKKSTPLFEHIPCKRCGGSGEYSFCLRFGKTCFRCNGKGTELTKRGVAAQEFYTAIFTVPAASLVPGNLVWEMGMTMGGDLYHRWMRVVENDTEKMELTLMDGKEPSVFGYHAGNTKRRAPKNNEERDAARKAALEYQATLTQAGTVRKVRSSK